MAGVNHQPLKVSIVYQSFQDFFPDPLVTPTAKPTVYILPVPIRFRQVPPWRPCAQDPEYTVDELSSISGIASTRPIFTDGIWPDFFPRFVTYIVPVLFSCHFLTLRCFEGYYITFLLTIPSNEVSYQDPNTGGITSVPGRPGRHGQTAPCRPLPCSGDRPDSSAGSRRRPRRSPRRR